MERDLNYEQCITKIVEDLKSKGTFDQFRRECLAEVDTKPSYRNLLQRVEGYLLKFFQRQSWSPSLNKTQLRNQLRNEINNSDLIRSGIEHLADQVINEEVENQFKSKIEEALYSYLDIPTKEEFEELSKDSFESNNENDDIKICEKEPEENSQPTDTKVEDEEVVTKIEDVHKEDKSNDFVLKTESEIKDDSDLHESIVNDLKQEFAFLSESITNTEDNSENVNLKDSTEQPSIDSDAMEIDDSNSNQEPLSEVKTEDIEFKQEDFETNNENIETKSNENSQNTKIKDEEIDNESDISSVHTSDLSDFENEISFDDSEEENEVTKKKISLKIVEELTASVTEDKDSDKKSSISNSKIKETDDKGNNKRERKINQKFMSDDYNCSRKGKRSQANKLNDKVLLKSKQILKKSIEKETKLNKLKKIDVLEDNVKSKKSIAQKRSAQSNKRYDSSDLYKPRLSLSSRRNRHGIDPLTPESNSNSTNDDK